MHFFTFSKYSKQGNRFYPQIPLFSFTLILETCCKRRGFGEMCALDYLCIKKANSIQVNFLDKSKIFYFPPCKVKRYEPHGLHIEWAFWDRGQLSSRNRFSHNKHEQAMGTSGILSILVSYRSIGPGIALTRKWPLSYWKIVLSSQSMN